MNLTSLKVLVLRNCPRVMIKLLFRFYRGLQVAAEKCMRLSKSEAALYLRISERKLRRSDRLALTSKGSPELRAWNEAFEAYESASTDTAASQRHKPMKLAWVHKPTLGNFGDWLSPYLLRKAAENRPVHHINLMSSHNQLHLLGLGSIASYSNRNSIVLGAGVNSMDDCLSRDAQYVMVRGHVTREAIPTSARSENLICCDPGFFIREIYRPRQFGHKEKKRLLIPHINHNQLFEKLDRSGFEYLNAHACRPKDLENKIDMIANAAEVVTSAMHIFVVCCVYSIPCALIKPKSGNMVSGDGIKYTDCMSPVLTADFRPEIVDMRAGARVSEIIETKAYDIDFDHIAKAYKVYKEAAART